MATMTSSTNSRAAAERRVRKHLQMVCKFMEPGMTQPPHPYRLLLDHGRSFTPAPKPKGIRWGRMKQCYYNAFNLMMADPELTYCEGFGGIWGIDIPHAWCCTPDGTVVDNTWRIPGSGSNYFGIPIKREVVMDLVARTGVCGEFLIYGRLGPEVLAN